MTKRELSGEKILLLVFLFAVMFVGSVSAADVAYIYSRDFNVDNNIKNVFAELNLSVDMIKESKVTTTDFSKYKFIFIGDERFSNPTKIPINKYPSVVTNYYYGPQWGLTDDDGISKLARTEPLSVKQDGTIIQVYTDAMFDTNRVGIPYYYLGVHDKSSDMTQVAGTYSGNGYDLGDVISYASSGSALENGKFALGNICFFGIVESDYWTDEARNMFLECIGFVGSTCSKDSECSSDVVGEKYCMNGSVYRDTKDYFCYSPGTIKSECKYNTISNLVESCAYGCVNATCKSQCTEDSDCPSGMNCINNSCVTIKCFNNANCGTDKLLNQLFCKNDNVFDKYLTFICNNPGTVLSSCSNSTLDKSIQNCTHGCSNGYCLTSTCVDYDKDSFDTCNPGQIGDDGKPMDCNDENANVNPGAVEICNGIDDDCDGLIDEGSNLCAVGKVCSLGSCIPIICSTDDQCNDNNPNTADKCINPGTTASYCEHNTINCDSNDDCGVNGLLNQLSCKNKEVFDKYITFMCNNPAKSNSYCTNSTQEYKVKTCPDKCQGGQCVNINCEKDSDCDDSNANTIDKCLNPGTPSSSCSHTQVACFKNTDCGTTGFAANDYCMNDNSYEDYLTYSCVNPGTALSYCSMGSMKVLSEYCDYQCINGDCITCFSDPQCGKDAYVGKRYCMNGDAYQDFQEFKCSDAGTKNSDCTSTIYSKKVEDCLGVCAAGICKDVSCVADKDCDDSDPGTYDSCNNAGTGSSYCAHTPVNCGSDADCGINGYMGNEFCISGDVFKNLESANCVNPGKLNSYCSVLISADPINDCGDSYCESWGSNYCKNDNVYHSRMCYNRDCLNGACTSSDVSEEKAVQTCLNGCLNGGCIDFVCDSNSDCDDGNENTEDVCTNPGSSLSSCQHNTITCTGNSQCGTDAYVGDSFCDNGNVQRNYRTYTCNLPGTSDSYCSVSTNSRTTETCSSSQICSSGDCIQNPCVDSDGDGYDTCSTGTTGDDGRQQDCNDNNVNVNPGRTEICNGIDDDCDGLIDENNGNCASGQTCTNGQCITSCTNECSSSGTNICDGNSYKTCGNYDSDSCLEWSSLVGCSSGQICSNGNCLSITCSTNSQCGTDGYLNQLFCSNNNVYDKYKTYTCNNAGTSSSSCSSSITDILKQTCSYGCSDKFCIVSNCVDNDGDSYDNCAPGTTGDDGKQQDCNDNNANINPGRTEICNGIDDDCDGLIDENNGNCASGQTCTNGQCITSCTNECSSSGTNICDGNSYKTCGNYDSDSCLEWSSLVGCSSGQVCQSGQCIAITCSTNSQCGTDGYLNQLFCKDGNVFDKYRTYACNNPGSSISFCSSSLSDVLKQKCANGQICENGLCKDITCWSDYNCNDNNPLTVDVCINPGTSSSSCTHTPLVCSQKSDCGTDGWIGSPICGDNVSINTIKSVDTRSYYLAGDDANIFNAGLTGVLNRVGTERPYSVARGEWCNNNANGCDDNDYFTYIDLNQSSDTIYYANSEYSSSDTSCIYSCPQNYALVNFAGEWISQTTDCNSYVCRYIGSGGDSITMPGTYYYSDDACYMDCPDGYALRSAVAEWPWSPTPGNSADCNSYICQKVTLGTTTVSGNVYQNYKTYTCNNPGTSSSSCSNTSTSQLKQTCANGCSNGACIVSTCVDSDGDTYDNCAPGTSGDDGKQQDCNDNNANVNPGRTEICNGIDDDCDGLIDENNGNCASGQTCTNGQCVAIQVCKNWKGDSISNYYGITFTPLANTIAADTTNTLTLKLKNNDASTKTIVLQKYACRCKLHLGNPTGVCLDYWPFTFYPGTVNDGWRVNGCQLVNETFTLAGYGETVAQVSSAQYQNMACGLFQMDFALVSVNGQNVFHPISSSLLDLCVDCPNIICSSNSDCNDNNASTTDTCVNPGTTSSSCTHTNICTLKKFTWEIKCGDPARDNYNIACDESCGNCWLTADGYHFWRKTELKELGYYYYDSSNNLVRVPYAVGNNICKYGGQPESGSGTIPSGITIAGQYTKWDRGTVYYLYTDSSLNTISGVQAPYVCSRGNGRTDYYWEEQGSGGAHDDGRVIFTLSDLSCSSITCSSNSDCNDNNAGTTDTCVNPGTTSSYCTHTSPTCSSNSQCGTNELTGSLFCQSGNVYQNYRTFTCNNAGTSSSSCSNSTTAQLNQTCANGCSNGQCINIICSSNSDCNDNNSSTTDTCVNPGTSSSSCTHTTITCSSNSQCGTNAYTGSNYCSGTGVYKNYITYTCNNAGTSSSSCSSSTAPVLQQSCSSYQTCSSGSCVNQAQWVYTSALGSSCTSVCSGAGLTSMADSSGLRSRSGELDPNPAWGIPNNMYGGQTIAYTGGIYWCWYDAAFHSVRDYDWTDKVWACWCG